MTDLRVFSSPLKLLLQAARHLSFIWLCFAVKLFLCEASKTGCFFCLCSSELAYPASFPSPRMSHSTICAKALRGVCVCVCAILIQTTPSFDKADRGVCDPLKRKHEESLLCVEQRFVWSFCSLGPSQQSSVFERLSKKIFSSAEFFLRPNGSSFCVSILCGNSH